jgi:hypothetical protein
MPSRTEACREAPKTSLQFWQSDSTIVAAVVNKRTSKEFGTCTKDQKSENGTVVHSLAVLGDLGTTMFALASIPGTH